MGRIHDWLRYHLGPEENRMDNNSETDSEPAEDKRAPLPADPTDALLTLTGPLDWQLVGDNRLVLRRNVSVWFEMGSDDTDKSWVRGGAQTHPSVVSQSRLWELYADLIHMQVQEADKALSEALLHFRIVRDRLD